MQQRVAENDDGDDVEFEAPAADGETTIVTRDASQLSKLLHLASARGVYEQLLVTGVALTEDYLQGIGNTKAVAVCVLWSSRAVLRLRGIGSVNQN